MQTWIVCFILVSSNQTLSVQMNVHAGFRANFMIPRAVVRKYRLAPRRFTKKAHFLVVLILLLIKTSSGYRNLIKKLILENVAFILRILKKKELISDTDQSS